MERSLFHTVEKFEQTAVVGKMWGYEVWHFNTPVLCMKTLVIYPGFACSLHWHEVKYEIFTCLDSGDDNGLWITIGEQPERLLRRGEHVVIAPGVKHTFRCSGSSPAALLEFSTNHREGDSYREWPSHFCGGGKMDNMGAVAELKGKKVLIVGDVSLDEYHSGVVKRISPEAPVPVVSMDPYVPDVYQAPGCAANVAVNAAALGGEVFLVSIVGDDQAGQDLVSLMTELTIDTTGILVSDKRPTGTKLRVMSGQHHIVRIDCEETAELPGDLEKAVLLTVRQALDGVDTDVIYMADYDKGLLTPNVIAGIVTLATERKICTIADPKLRHFHNYEGVTILKPNDLRASVAMGLPARTESHVESLAAAIREELALEWCLLTRGSKGMYLSSGAYSEFIPPVYAEVSELSGAGDTAGAALSLAIAADIPVCEAARIANAAASVVVKKTGTAFCTPTELAEVLNN